MKFKYRLLVYIGIVMAFGFLRYQLDKENVFISSDGQIKFYQAAGHRVNGFGSFECIYPAKEIDPEFKYFIFEYPWAFIREFHNAKCFFQYPPMFAYLGAVVMNLFGDRAVLYVSLVLYLLCIAAFDLIERFLGVSDNVILLSAVAVFGLSFVPLANLDFSEMSLYDLLLLCTLYFSGLLLHEPDVHSRRYKVLSFSIGLLAVFTFFVRSEIALFVALFAGISVFLNYRTLGYKNLILYGLLGAGISLAGMFAFNYWSVGNVMGMRAFTVLNDLTDSGKSELVRHLLIAKGYLYGDAEMRGIILAFPLVLSAALFFVPRLVRPLSSFAKACIFSGVGFIVLGSFLIPVKGGVQNFGLRYLDTGFLSLALGVTAGLDFWMKGRVGKQKWLALLVVLIMLYPAGKFLNTGIRTLTRSAPLYNKIQANFQEVGDGYVVHESLNTSYLVGISFLKQKHVYIATDESMRKLERSLSERKVQRFMIMHFDQTPYLTGALPKESYHNYFTKLTFKPTLYDVVREETFLSFRMTYYHLRTSVR